MNQDEIYRGSVPNTGLVHESFRLPDREQEIIRNFHDAEDPDRIHEMCRELMEDFNWGLQKIRRFLESPAP